MSEFSESSSSSSSSGSRLVTVRKSSTTSMQKSGTDPIPNWSEPDWSEFGAQNDSFDGNIENRLNFKRKPSKELPGQIAFKIPKPPRPKWNLLTSGLNPALFFQESQYQNDPPKSPIIYGNQQDWAKGPCIGRGGQAKVYLMTHKFVGENCVMKVIDISRDEAEVLKLKTECEILMKLQHPRIVKYLWFAIDTNEREARIYMELMQV